MQPNPRSECPVVGTGGGSARLAAVDAAPSGGGGRPLLAASVTAVTVRAVEPAERLLGGKAETERESCDRCLGFCGTYLLMSVTLVIASFVYITFDLWDSFYADDHIVMMCQLKPGHAAAYQPFCEDSDTKDACERFAETCSWSPGISKEHVNILDYGLNSTISTCSVRLGVNSTNRPSKPDPCHAAMEQDCGASVKGPASIVCMGAHDV